MKNKLTDNKIILIKRQTRLDELLIKFNTLEQAKFYIEHLGADFSDYKHEDLIYKEAVKILADSLSELGRVQMLDRRHVPNFIFGKQDIIVVIGQDGLVANVLKYLDGQPVVAINPDPQRWDGILLPFSVKDAKSVIKDCFNKQRKLKEITFAKAMLNDGQSLYAVNDFFIGPKSHTSAQYLINYNNQTERQSSSGIIVSTGLGSTGWFKSIITGARSVTASTGFQKNAPEEAVESYPWNADYLFYSVREPFPSNNTATELVFGQINQQHPLAITSQMASHGVIFSDGIEKDFIPFNSGTKVIITVAKDKSGFLVV